jgi:hypothetical protein
MNRYGEGAWDLMPFVVQNRDREKEQLDRVKTAHWGYFRLTRDLADTVFGDPRYPCPKKAVVDPREFRGWDRVSMRARGTYRDVEPDNLRELTRQVLQRLRGKCFINNRYHAGRPDPHIVNPYGNELYGLKLRMPGVVSQEGFTS